MDNKAKKIEMKDLVDYCNNYGFIFQGSEIYGGLANTWDYGPLGSRLKNTIKDAWRYFFIQKRDNAYEVDADILMNPRVWEVVMFKVSLTHWLTVKNVRLVTEQIT